MRAIELPQRAEALREAGVTAPDVREALEAARERRVPIQETVQLLEDVEQTVQEHGPVDAFGGFVKARLDEGLRGRDLARAIAEEHAARGKGPPEGRGRPDEAGPGRSGDAGRGADKGPPEGRGAGDKGPPEGKGPEARGPAGSEGRRPAADPDRERTGGRPVRGRER